jgi:L-fucose mutarotase
MKVTVAMLIGLPPLLGPEMLFTLRAMGHGDELALVDGNYPAQDHARRLIRADGLGLIAVLEAVLQVLPLEAVFRASQDNDPAQKAAIHDQIDRMCQRAGQAAQPLSGDELYPRIRAAHTIIATSERELFANVILRKGALSPVGT